MVIKTETVILQFLEWHQQSPMVSLENSKDY